METLALILALLANDFRPSIASVGSLRVTVQADLTYSWTFKKDGEMLVRLAGALPSAFLVEARRKVGGEEIVVGRSGEVCRCGAGPHGWLVVSVWPLPGRVLMSTDEPAVLLPEEAAP